jgi:hypothetical protein
MNVLNVDEIERTLGRFAARAYSPHIKRWVLTVARNYFLAKLPEKDVISNFRPIVTHQTRNLSYHSVEAKKLPEWALSALERGEKLMWFDPVQVTRREFWNVLEIIVLWFNNWKKDDTRLNRVDRICFPVATNAAVLWYKDVSTNIWKYVTDKPILIKTYEHGFHWVKLVTALQFEREGRLMNHCVGNGVYFGKFRTASDVEYYSLRDVDNQPHVTMEIGFNSTHPLVRKGHVSQCKGNSNAKPEKCYQPYISRLLKDMTWTIEGDGSHIDT